jgi:hypothetical protein
VDTWGLSVPAGRNRHERASRLEPAAQNLETLGGGRSRPSRVVFHDEGFQELPEQAGTALGTSVTTAKLFSTKENGSGLLLPT